MPLLPPLPEPVAFEEVAAVLNEAVLQARGGPPYVTGAAGWHLANALSAAGFHVARAPADAGNSPSGAREMPDGTNSAP